MKIIKAMHIYKNKDGGFYIRGNKSYTWEFSKKLYKENIYAYFAEPEYSTDNALGCAIIGLSKYLGE